MTPATIDGWLHELGIVPDDRADREGLHSWDILLDGRVRPDVRMTLILDPTLCLVCWVHYAPPINDSFRVSYRQLLRWNDELPFVKFAVSPDERPVLTLEVPVAHLDRDALGLVIARAVRVCDLLYPESLRWLHPGAKVVPAPGRPLRPTPLLDRYAADLGELAEAPTAPDGSATDLVDDGAEGDPDD
ncbi:MAG: YbjN domain-containing protein [Chloroflexi bacterium]|nr:YbjN domain-containing protein [Chloroflexota bacterium]